MGPGDGQWQRASYKVRQSVLVAHFPLQLELFSSCYLLTMASLVEFKPHARDSDAASDAGSDKEPVDVTTALIGTTGRALGAPEVRRRFWWSRVKASDPDAIATQVTLLPVHKPMDTKLTVRSPAYMTTSSWRSSTGRMQTGSIPSLINQGLSPPGTRHQMDITDADSTAMQGEYPPVRSGCSVDMG